MLRGVKPMHVFCFLCTKTDSLFFHSRTKITPCRQSFSWSVLPTCFLQSRPNSLPHGCFLCIIHWTTVPRTGLRVGIVGIAMFDRGSVFVAFVLLAVLFLVLLLVLLVDFLLFQQCCLLLLFFSQSSLFLFGFSFGLFQQQCLFFSVQGITVFSQSCHHHLHFVKHRSVHRTVFCIDAGHAIQFRRRPTNPDKENTKRRRKGQPESKRNQHTIKTQLRRN